MSASRKPNRFHGRIEGSERPCAQGDCAEPGEFRAPAGRHGAWQWLCLDHVREFNAGYNFFAGMSTDEIYEAQHPIHGWAEATHSRRRIYEGTFGTPAWEDFADPLDAIGARFSQRGARPANGAQSRFTAAERKALTTLALGESASRRDVRTAYTALVRRYHPDHNGGNRNHEARLQAVVEAYQLLRKSAVLA